MVKIGCEALRKALAGKKIALMMNHSAIDNDGRNMIDVICTDWGCDVALILAMEHGVRGNMTTGFHDLKGVDAKTGVRMESLYQFPGCVPPVDLVKTVDAVVFSAQDAGSRCYTYAPWMCYLMESAAEAGTEVIVLDRPNPLGGQVLEGGCIGNKPEVDTTEYFRHLLGCFPYPLRHGLTIGEMAKMYNDYLPQPAKLTVVPMEGYTRDMWFEDTNLPWTPPSPAIPTPETLLPYTGMVFFDWADVSVGRGTALPFYYCGAPYVDAQWLTDAVNALKLPGVRCVEAYWQPQFNKCKGEACGGILMNITDPRAFNPTEFAVRLAFLLTEKYPDKMNWDEDQLAVRSGSTLLGDTLTGKCQGNADTVLAAWEEECKEFDLKRKPYLIYE